MGKEPVPDEILHLGDIDDGQGIHMSVPPKKTATGLEKRIDAATWATWEHLMVGNAIWKHLTNKNVGR